MNLAPRCVRNILELKHYRCLKKLSVGTNRVIHTTPTNQLFWEKSKKGDYEKDLLKNVTRKQLILDGLKQLKAEIKLWNEEMKEKLIMDPIMAIRPGEVDVVFSFETDQDFEKWTVASDSDHNEGFSKALFDRSPDGYGHFHGNVLSRVPKDGRIKRTGYCNIRSIRPRMSFKRPIYFDWTTYNTLVMRIRGDGRSYLINMSCEGYYDVLWHDIFHYVLYTRGGPHWQTVRIPFSKFFLASKGRVQDRQHPISLDRVSHVGFTVGAKQDMDGPFSLEIDYIGVEFDPNHTEEFAYEMYEADKFSLAS